MYVLGVVAMVGVDPLQDAPGGELVAVVAADLAGGVVDVDGDARRVDDDDEHRSGVERRGQHPVALRRETDLCVAGGHVRLIWVRPRGGHCRPGVPHGVVLEPGTRQTAEPPDGRVFRPLAEVGNGRRPPHGAAPDSGGMGGAGRRQRSCS